MSEASVPVLIAAWRSVRPVHRALPRPARRPAAAGRETPRHLRRDEGARAVPAHDGGAARRRRGRPDHRRLAGRHRRLLHGARRDPLRPGAARHHDAGRDEHGPCLARGLGDGQPGAHRGHPRRARPRARRRTRLRHRAGLLHPGRRRGHRAAARRGHRRRTHRARRPHGGGGRPQEPGPPGPGRRHPRARTARRGLPGVLRRGHERPPQGAVGRRDRGPQVRPVPPPPTGAGRLLHHGHPGPVRLHPRHDQGPARLPRLDRGAVRRPRTHRSGHARPGADGGGLGPHRDRVRGRGPVLRGAGAPGGRRGEGGRRRPAGSAATRPSWTASTSPGSWP